MVSTVPGQFDSFLQQRDHYGNEQAVTNIGTYFLRVLLRPRAVHCRVHQNILEIRLVSVNKQEKEGGSFNKSTTSKLDRPPATMMSDNDGIRCSCHLPPACQ